MLFEVLFANPLRETCIFGLSECGVEIIVATWPRYFTAISNRVRFGYCLNKACYSDM